MAQPSMLGTSSLTAMQPITMHVPAAAPPPLLQAWAAAVAAEAAAAAVGMQELGLQQALDGGSGQAVWRRVCGTHMKQPVVIMAGGKRSRFCQECKAFHELDHFDQDRKSCRKALNVRRQASKRKSEAWAQATAAAAATQDAGSSHGGLFAASSTCNRLYDLALPLYGEHLQRLQEQAAAAKEASGATSRRSAGHSVGSTCSAAVSPDICLRATRAGLRQQRAACGQYLKLACTHCGTIPKGHKAKAHPVNENFRLCRQCAKLEDYKMITLDNAMETYGLLKTDLRRLPQFRETKKMPGKGGSSRWKTYSWYCLQDVERRAEELFGEGFRDRADLLAHED
ncbi:hypothetical protein N2152v2_003380 [Parachlorella kessleri]